MVIDSVKSFERYKNFHRNFDKVYDFIKNNDLSKLEVGKYPIVKNEIWCSISVSDGRSLDNMPQMEVHDSFIDIHILLDGNETMGFKNRSLCNISSAAYNEADDIALFDEFPEVFVSCGINNFVICFPTDGHTPLLGEGKIKKAIFKVRL
jgi:biofilm protein TabA